MGPPSEVTGGIFQDLASFAIFFALREAQFSTFSFGRAKQKAASHSTLNDFGVVQCAGSGRLRKWIVWVSKRTMHFLQGV